MGLPVPGTILVYVGLDAVGDGLMKLPFLRGLRAVFPQSRITWMAGKGHTVYAGALAPLVAGLADDVVDQAGIGSRVGELIGPHPLAGRRFDLIIDTQRRVLTTLILRRIRHERMISGAAGFALSSVRPRRGWVRPASMAGQLMALLDLARGGGGDGQPPGPAPLSLDPAVLDQSANLLPDGPVYIGFAPGAGGKYKCWPLDRYVDLARIQVEKGRVPVFLLGPGEVEWVDGIRAAVPAALFPLQQTGGPVTPMLTIALGRRLAAAVANDSGTGHMLAAADTALISLFGPTPAAKFAPLTRRAWVITAQSHGGDEMERIPLAAVGAVLDDALAKNPG